MSIIFGIIGGIIGVVIVLGIIIAVNYYIDNNRDKFR